MKNFRFYAELPESHGSKSACKKHGAFTVANITESARWGKRLTVIAVYLDDNGRPVRTGSGKLECVASLFNTHSSYANSSASDEYLRKRATRISEDLARKLSPELFAYLA